MASEQISEYDLLQLKVAIEHQSAVLDTVLRTVQDVQHQSMKTDKRVGILETDVKQILSKRSTCPKCQDSQPVTTAQMSNSNYNSTKEEIMEATRAEMAELKSVVKEEVSRHGNMSTQHQDELLSRLDKVDQVILPQLSEMSEEIKTTAAHLETLEKGTKALENSMNEYTTKLNYLQENLIPKAEMTNKLQALTEAANQQTDCSDQLHKEEVNNRLVKLTDTVEALSTTVDTIKSKLDPRGGIEKMVTKHTRTLIDQLIADGQLIQEVVQHCRNVRKSYTCDLHVEDFEGCIGSVECQYSTLWYIDQWKTHVKGMVRFSRDQTLEVRLVHGRYPPLLGLEPVQVKLGFSVAVTALKQPGRSGGNKELGSKRDTYLAETDIRQDCDGWVISWGLKICTVACKDLNTEDFIENGKLCLRYEISIL